MPDDGAFKLGEYMEKKRLMEEKERFFVAALESASKMLEEKDYEGAIGVYKELIPLAEDMAWIDKISMLNDFIHDARDKERQDAVESKQRLSVEERKAKERAAYNEALDVMGRASDAHVKKDFDAALALYKESLVLLREINASHEIRIVNESIAKVEADIAKFKKLEGARSAPVLEDATPVPAAGRDDAVAGERAAVADRKAREKATYNEALDVMGRASDAHAGKDFDAALALYKESLVLLREINALHEIRIVNESIAKVEADIAKFKRLEGARTAPVLEDAAPVPAPRSASGGDDAGAGARAAAAERKAREKATYNEALDVMGRASDAHVKKDFDAALALYNQSLDLLSIINASHEIRVVNESIAKVEADIIKFKKLDAGRAKASDGMKQAMADHEARLLQEDAKITAMRERELARARAIEEQKALENKHVDEAMELLDKANAQLKDAASLNFVSVEAKKARYDEVIALYDDAAGSFKLAGWVEEADKVRDTIIKIKRERDAGLEVLAKKLAKEADAIATAREPVIIKEPAGGKEDKLAAEIMGRKLEQQQKRDASFAALEEAGSALEQYEKKPKIIGGQVFKENEYPEIIRLYRKALGLFKDAGWTTEAARIEESIEILRKKERDFLNEKDLFDRQQQDASKAADATVSAMDARQKAALDRMRRDTVVQTKIEASKAREKASRDEIDAHLTRAMAHYQKFEYAKSEAEYKTARQLMVEQGWAQEAENVQETIVMIAQKREERERLLLKKERAIDDVGSFARGIEELSTGMDLIQKQQVQAELESKQADVESRKAIQEKRENAYYTTLGHAQACMNKKDYQAAIQGFKDALALAEELNWMSQVRDVRDFIALAQERQRIADLQAVGRPQETTSPVAQPGPVSDGHAPVDQPAAPPVTQRQREREIGDRAYALIDQANARWKDGEREAAIGSFEEAMKTFESIGWTRERDAVVQQVRAVEKEIEDEKLFAAKKQEGEKTRLAYQAIDDAERCLRNKETNEATVCYERAIELFESINWTKEAGLVRAQLEKVKEEVAKKLVADLEGSETQKVDKAYALIDEARKYQHDRKIFKAVECAQDALAIFKGLGDSWSREIGQVQRFVDELLREKTKKEELIKKLKLGDF